MPSVRRRSVAARLAGSLVALLLVAGCSGDTADVTPPTDSTGVVTGQRTEESPGATPATLDHLVTMKQACPRLRLIMHQLGTIPTTHTSVLAGFRLHELRAISDRAVWPVIDRFLVVVGTYVAEPSGQAFANARAAEAAATKNAEEACRAVGSSYSRSS